MHNETLLLVEDSEDDAFFFSRAFEKAELPLSVHHAENGSQAIEYLKQSTKTNSLPKVIFLDLKMPILNGFDVLTWVQKQGLTGLRIFVLSGSDHQKDKERARELGAEEFVVKPITVPDLQRLVEKTFNGENHLTKGKSEIPS